MTTIEELFAAITKLDAARVVELLEIDRDLARMVHRGESALSIACMIATTDGAIPTQDGGDVAHQIVATLLESGADPAHRSQNGWTPLHLAGCAGNTKLSLSLLAAGASASAVVAGTEGATPLSFALFYAHRETAVAIASGERAPDDLRCAAGLDDTTGAERWLDEDGRLRPGADSGMAFTAPISAFPPREAAIDDQLTIDESLTWASRNGSLAAMKFLVGRGASVNANPYRGTALLWAIYSDQAKAAQWLIENGAEVNLRHDFGGAEHGKGATALHLAAQYGCAETLEVLLAAGADVSIVDEAHNATPAGWAAHSGNRKLARRLKKLEKR